MKGRDQRGPPPGVCGVRGEEHTSELTATPKLGKGVACQTHEEDFLLAKKLLRPAVQTMTLTRSGTPLTDQDWKNKGQDESRLFSVEALTSRIEFQWPLQAVAAIKSFCEGRLLIQEISFDC